MGGNSRRPWILPLALIAAAQIGGHLSEASTRRGLSTMWYDPGANHENPGPFMTLLGRVLPIQNSGRQATGREARFGDYTGHLLTTAESNLSALK